MSGSFEVNGASGKTADTKPQLFIDDVFVKTNISNGDYTIEDMGYGTNQTINLKDGGIVAFIDYGDSRAEFSVPMSPDLYTMGYCKDMAQSGTHTVKLIDKHMGVAIVCTNAIADFPKGVSLTPGSDMRWTFKGDPLDFVAI